jgi:hypothetical protein
MACIPRGLAKSLMLILILLLTLQFIASQPAHAQTTPTLADTISAVLEKIEETNSSWNVIYDQIFCRQNASVYDNAIIHAVKNLDYQNAIFIARLAELNNYTSQTINDALTVALTNMPMCGSLPITYNDPISFLLYDRYMLNAYRYAQNLGISGWDINTAFNDFSKAYVSSPQSSESGELLYINPQQNSAKSYSSRYYDEHAETLSMFLLFAFGGFNDAMPYADDAWLNTQTHWNGQFYGYMNTGVVECEMGNFAQVIAQYRNSRGDIPYFNRVVEDLEDTLLVNEFNSSAWGSVGVIRHAEGNSQNRLYETMGNLIALQMLYPNFAEGNQTNFQKMIQIGWRGLVNSTLFYNNQFSFIDQTSPNLVGPYEDDASLLGAMTLFLYGIIPRNGSLAMTPSNERYQDYRTCFQTSQWQFNYNNQSIRIPIFRGNLTFIFGSQDVSCNFPEDGVYDIQFSADWNSITSASKIENISRLQLSPVTLETLPKNPKPTATPAPTNPPSATPQPSTPSPTANSTATPTPTTAVTPSEEPKNTPSSTPQNNGKTEDLQFTYVYIASAIILLAMPFSVAILRYVKRKA